MTREISSLAEIADSFDAVLIDQYGVLHDGRRPFPGAIDAVRALVARHVPMVALSNSGKRAAYNTARLAQLGFRENWFRAMVTSGELAHQRIAAMLADGRLSPGDRVSILTRGDEGGAIEGYPLQRVGLDGDPVLVLIAGAEPERIGLEACRAALAPLAARGVPALCTNPDLRIYVEGGSAYGPGAVAEAYREAGGPVSILGKPGAEMFAAGLTALGDPDPARVLMIGDSPHHDIAGAKAAGCQALLIRGGVQAEEATASPADFAMDTLRA